MGHFKKIVVSNHIVEVYTYEKMQFSEFESNGGRKAGFVSTERKSVNATRQMLRRLILSNFDSNSKFITLTFADNVQCLDTANGEFKRFIQRLRYKYEKFKYLAVIEFQERGAVHYHMISDLPYIPKSEIAEIWRNGFVKVNNISHVDNVGAYMIKYMVKDLADSRLSGRKAYLYSKGLDKPVTLRGEDAERAIQAFEVDMKKPVYTNGYEGEYTGHVDYTEYNLKR